MNIIYFSVHAILEDDEVRLLKRIGHNVFCLGNNCKDGVSQPFRPAIEWNATELYLYEQYESLGGDYDRYSELPIGFEGHFSCAIVMHDLRLVEKHWLRFRNKKMIWRTIGQTIDACEAQAASFRAEGLIIARYSSVEAWASGYLGGDALLRFYKDPAVYGDWVGGVNRPLMFANHLSDRYPSGAELYCRLAAMIDCSLGGMANDSLPGAIGVPDFEKQIALYRTHACYVYFTGLHIPYTLSFIEAWMTGIPLVVYAPIDKIDKYFEIDRIVQHGVNAILCRDFDSLTLACRTLCNDHSLASRLGSAGRDAAKALFGQEKIERQWQVFLDRVSMADQLLPA